MKNPWLKKNPLLSMWLSGANAAAGSARGRAGAAASRLAAHGANEAARAWAAAWLPAAPAKKASPKRRRRG